MKHDPFPSAPAGCDAIQAQLSDSADSGTALTPELQAHLDTCADCARFAEQWLPGPPAELSQPLPAAPAAHLRERILHAAAQPDVVQFPASSVARPPWTAWLGRIAACLALAGFAYWLLNPVATPVKKRPALAAEPTLSQGLAQMENRTKHEQQVLQTALVDGGREVNDNVAWSVSALEL